MQIVGRMSEQDRVNEKGAVSIEYLAIALVVAVVLGVVLAAAGSARGVVQGGFMKSVGEIFNN